MIQTWIVEKLSHTIEQRAADDLSACNIGGASVLVAQSGNVIYRKHFGVASPDGVPVTDRTLFRLASMTKPITAAAAMLLSDKGLLSLDDTVDRYYPTFASMQIRNEDGTLSQTDCNITVRDILTHSSGIGSGAAWSTSVKQMTDTDVDSVEHFVSFLSRQPLSFVPKTKQEYSGIGAFSVLTGIIQKITDMPYGEFLKREIFVPCDMSSTTFEPSRKQWEQLITMHGKVNGSSTVGQTHDGCVFEFIPPQNPLGGAGLIASVEDYWHFAQMLANGGSFHESRVLSEEAVRELSKPQFFKRANESWGLGVRVVTEGEGRILPVGSYGWSGAYGTHFWIDPEREIIAIYMKNSRYDGGSGAVTARNFEKDVYASLA